MNISAASPWSTDGYVFMWTPDHMRMILIYRGRNSVWRCLTAAVWLWTCTGSSCSTGSSTTRTTSPPSGPRELRPCTGGTTGWSCSSTPARPSPTCLWATSLVYYTKLFFPFFCLKISFSCLLVSVRPKVHWHSSSPPPLTCVATSELLSYCILAAWCRCFLSRRRLLSSSVLNTAPKT